MPFVSSEFFNDLTRQWREEAEVARARHCHNYVVYQQMRIPRTLSRIISPSAQARPVEKLSNQDIFDASEFVSKNTATLECARCPCACRGSMPVTPCGRYFRAFRRMDKSKPIFPNYVSKQQPTGVLWDNKFRLFLINFCIFACRHFPLYWRFNTSYQARNRTH